MQTIFLLLQPANCVHSAAASGIVSSCLFVCSQTLAVVNIQSREQNALSFNS